MIGLNDFHRRWAETRADVLRAVEETGQSGWYILGGALRSFETNLAACWGLPHAVGVASGLDAIELALRASACGPGDFVLTSPVSAFATALAIVKTGATPVFADCEPNGLVDLDDCRRILDRHPRIRYFVPVHLFGHCLDLEQLTVLRDRYELRIVEDCAQSIGSRWRGSAASGTVGQFAATSFYPTKNLGALGDGGAILTSSDEGAETVRQLRDYGQSAKYRHDRIGYNSRLDELQAAILDRAFLPRLPEWTEKRREVARRYREGIRPPASWILPEPPDHDGSCWHLFPILPAAGPEGKAGALAHLRAYGIGTGEHYPLAQIEQRALDGLDLSWSSACERAIRFCRSEISLPIHPHLTDEEVGLVVRALNAFVLP